MGKEKSAISGKSLIVCGNCMHWKFKTTAQRDGGNGSKIQTIIRVGECKRYPPTATPLPGPQPGTAMIQGFYPPTDEDAAACGEFSAGLA